MPFAAAIPLVSAGIGALSGLFGNKSRTANSSNSYKRILTPEQEQAQDFISKYSQQMIENPEADLGPMKGQALQRVSESYQDLPSQMMERFASRGMAGSGKLIGKLRDIDLNRASAMAGLEGEFSQLALARRDQGMGNLQQLLGQTFQSEGTASQQTPGNAIGGALNGGVQGGIFGAMMQKYLKPAGATTGKG